MSPTTAPSSRWPLAALSLCMLLSSLAISIANVALPTLARAFNATFGQVQWVVIAYLLAVTTVVVSVGRLGDLFGRRRLLIAGIALFTAASLLCACAPTLWLLIAARAVQGLGAAAMMALSMALAGEALPKSKTGSAMGLLGTMSAVGTALGPTLGGMLITGLGWPAIFLINIPLGMLAAQFVHSFLPPDLPSEKRPGFNRAGTFLLPLFRNRALSAGFAMSVLVTAVVMATLVVGPFYLSATLALDVARVGLVMSCGPIASALSGVPAGLLIDRFGARRIGTAGLWAMAVGSATLPSLAAHFGVAGYIGALVVITAGYALFQAANNTAVMTAAAPEQRGAISGLLALSRNLGLIAGASVMGAIFALGGIGLAFGAATLLIAVALVISTVKNPPK